MFFLFRNHGIGFFDRNGSSIRVGFSLFNRRAFFLFFFVAFIAFFIVGSGSGSSSGTAATFNGIISTIFTVPALPVFSRHAMSTAFQRASYTVTRHRGAE